VVLDGLVRDLDLRVGMVGGLVSNVVLMKVFDLRGRRRSRHQVQLAKRPDVRY
jgi:hypothetical protein